jgi:NADPH-dependent F420 reductase
MSSTPIAIVGGTGALGSALARRFAAAGHKVLLGSRQETRAIEAAKLANAAVGADLVRGSNNAGAAVAADLVVLTIPFEAMLDALPPLAAATAGKTVVSTLVPMTFQRGLAYAVSVAEGSAAQRAQDMLPAGHVVGAFHHLSASVLADLASPLDADILVCGDHAEAKEDVFRLVTALPGARALDVGGLDAAGVIESFTVALLRLNRRYRGHSSLRITHLTVGRPPAGED